MYIYMYIYICIYMYIYIYNNNLNLLPFWTYKYIWYMRIPSDSHSQTWQWTAIRWFPQGTKKGMACINIMENMDISWIGYSTDLIDSLTYYLVGGLEPWNFMTFHSVGNVIIPTDEHIFQRGRYTTNQLSIIYHDWPLYIHHYRSMNVWVPCINDTICITLVTHHYWAL